MIGSNTELSRGLCFKITVDFLFVDLCDSLFSIFEIIFSFSVRVRQQNYLIRLDHSK